MKRQFLFSFLVFTITIAITSCNDKFVPVDPPVIETRVSAKNRLNSAIRQAKNGYGDDVKLVLILGQGVIISGPDRGKTDITSTTINSDPNNMIAWIYIFLKPGMSSPIAYTPNPLQTAKDCWELRVNFDFNTLLTLIPDTSARNIISGTIALVNNPDFRITTDTTNIMDSDLALDFAISSNPIIRFDTSFVPGPSSINGNYFFTNDTAGYIQTANMFLIPAIGTLKLTDYIQGMTGFPSDLWIVNFKKTSGTIVQNLILGTVVQVTQLIGIPSISLTSKCINLSKYASKK
jgi:hypothetical protein